MTEKELRKLNRAELLELLIEQCEEVESLRQRLDAAEEELRNRDLAMEKAGSLAEAALLLNGVFEAAQSACAHYTENIEKMSQNQETVCAQITAESQARAMKIIADAELFREEMERETRKKCLEMMRRAKKESQRYWDELTIKLEDFYQQHEGLRELLAVANPQNKTKNM